MIKNDLNNALRTDDVSYLSNENEIINISKYRRLFKELLIAEKGIRCEIIGCEIKILELIIASHIKPVNEIINDNQLTTEEKQQEISDTNNGLLLCRNHDGLFDRNLITFGYDGTMRVSQKIINELHSLNLTGDRKKICINNDKITHYLEFHNKRFDYLEKFERGIFNTKR